jgi:AcrR family transcriptional regulator
MLDCAAEVFAEKGFSQATIRDIAARAGILSGSLYHHFDSKEAIAGEIVGRYFVGLRDRYAEVTRKGLNPLNALADLIRTGCRSVGEWPLQAAIVHNDWPQLLQMPDFEVTRKQWVEIEVIWIEVLRQGVESGEIRPDRNLQLAYRAMVGSIFALVRWHRPDGGLTMDEISQEYADLFIDGLKRDRLRLDLAGRNDP